METAARYLGYFVQPKIYCQLVLPTLDESSTTGHLRVLAAIISGSEQRALSQQLDKIANFLQQPDIIYAMSTESSIREEVDKLLKMLVNINSLEDIQDLFCNYVRPLITSIHDDCASWTVYSAESQIFCACLSRARVAILHNMDLVLPIFKKTMCKDADPELKLRHFILLSEYFLNNQNLYYHIEDPYKFVSMIIEELIVPELIWAAGRAAEAIRTVAVCCLCAILQNKIINPDKKDEINEAGSANEENKESKMSEESITPEQCLSIFNKIIPILISLMDDKAKKTRLYSIHAICLLVTIGQSLSCLNDEHIHQTYPVILKRLDDGCDDARYAAVKALVDVWSIASKDYDIVVNRNHVDALYMTMIIHLDDPESRFQEIILGNNQQFCPFY